MMWTIHAEIYFFEQQIEVACTPRSSQVIQQLILQKRVKENMYMIN